MRRKKTLRSRFYMRTSYIRSHIGTAFCKLFRSGLIIGRKYYSYENGSRDRLFEFLRKGCCWGLFRILLSFNRRRRSYSYFYSPVLYFADFPRERSSQNTTRIYMVLYVSCLSATTTTEKKKEEKTVRRSVEVKFTVTLMVYTFVLATGH